MVKKKKEANIKQEEIKKRKEKEKLARGDYSVEEKKNIIGDDEDEDLVF